MKPNDDCKKIDTPTEMEYPSKWPFNTKWSEQIEKEIGWYEIDKICGVIGAGTEIQGLLLYDGLRAFEKVIIQNQVIRKIKSNSIDYLKIRPSEIDWQNGNTWERHIDRLEVLELKYNTDEAPEEVKKALYFLKELIQEGATHAKKLISYIENEKAKIEAQEKERIDEINRNIPKPSAIWDQIDKNHSSVKEGFIYILSNSLMPGVFKIVFTSSNPDKRAKKISEQYRLPADFEVVSYWRTKDPYIVEQRIHAELSQHRKGGEFFSASLDLIKEKIGKNLIST